MIFNSIAIIVLLCGAMSITLGIYAWRQRSNGSAAVFAILMFSLAFYIIGYSMELSSRDLSTMLFWSKVQYIGILTFPTIFLLFVIRYAGIEKWQTRSSLALFLIPLALLIVKFMDEDLHLIYTSAAVDASGTIPLLSFTQGPLYTVMVGYNLLVVTLGNILLWRRWRFASSLYRQQTTIMLIAAGLIYVVYIYYLAGVPLFPTLKHLDLNPFAYTIWGFAISVAIFRYRLFELAPIARETLIENLSDGVIVLDAQARLVDANPEARRIFNWSPPPIGYNVEDLLPDWFDRATLHTVEDSLKIEAQLTKEDRSIYYEVTISTLKDKRARMIGHLIVVHDISGRKETEKKLQELSLVDELTGLNNRRGFKVLANQLILMASRMRVNAALIYIDMDHLKEINDSLGHAAGDQALIDTGHILKSTFRSSDVIARQGGDEFVIFAIESGEYSGAVMLERLKEKLSAHNTQADRSYRISLSIGLTQYRWEKPEPIDVLLAEADRAMYEDKQKKTE